MVAVAVTLCAVVQLAGLVLLLAINVSVNDPAAAKTIPPVVVPVPLTAGPIPVTGLTLQLIVPGDPPEAVKAVIPPIFSDTETGLIVNADGVVQGGFSAVKLTVAEVVPAMVVTIAVTVTGPGDSVSDVHVQLPVPLAVTTQAALAGASTVTLAPALAVPLTAGVR